MPHHRRAAKRDRQADRPRGAGPAGARRGRWARGRARLSLAWLTAVLWLTATAQSQQPDLQPAKTYAVICGVLQWQDSSIGNFPTENRKDRELYETLRELGVPEANMALLLDRDATAYGMRAAVAAVARRAPGDATFLFYYSGHGSRQQGATYFLNYDYAKGRGAQTGFNVAELAALLANNFRGRRVLLLSDCCYSGSLETPAAALHQRGYEALCLASSQASNTSTSYWTFTQTVIRALSGDPVLDLNSDGAIELREIVLEAWDAMKYRQSQMLGYKRFGMDTKYTFARVRGTAQTSPEIPPPLKYRQFVFVLANGKWLRGRIVDYRDGQYGVRLQFYSDSPTVYLPRERIKEIEFKQYPVGSYVTAVWKGREYQARVTHQVEDFHYITYPGFSTDWDEWVLSDRIVGLYQQVSREPVVQVLSSEKWYPAIVLQAAAGKYLVHYTGYDSSWHEWVAAERIHPDSRPRLPPMPAAPEPDPSAPASPPSDAEPPPKNERSDYKGLIAHYRQVVEADPERHASLNSLARLLAACPKKKLRNGEQAIELARRACELTDWTNAAYLDTYAAAWAETGDFAAARQWQKQAIRLAAGDSKDEAKARLKQYKQQQPLREDLPAPEDLPERP